MSADLLRRAAAKLREHAEAATEGPWLRAADHSVARGQYRDNEVGCWDGPYALQVTATGDGDEATADASFIALVHPPVALAVADLLEHLADDVSDAGDRVEPGGLVRDEYGSIRFDWTSALKLARAVLREPEGGQR